LKIISGSKNGARSGLNFSAQIQIFQPIRHPVRNDFVDQIFQQILGSDSLPIAAEGVDDRPEVFGG
jgi:hypothetical protein